MVEGKFMKMPSWPKLAEVDAPMMNVYSLPTKRAGGPLKDVTELRPCSWRFST